MKRIFMLLAPLALMLVAAMALSGVAQAEASTSTAAPPTKIDYVCVNKSTGQLFYLASCAKSQAKTDVTSSSTPFKACYQTSNGVTRKVPESTKCSNKSTNIENTIEKVPADSSSLYFCVKSSDGTMFFKPGTTAPTCPTGQYAVVIGSPNHAPSAVGDSYSTAEDTTLNVSTPGVLSNDSDPDGDTITTQLATGPSNGTLTLDSDGSFSYTPALNYNGTDSLTYKASDGKGGEATATVSITVHAVNDAPVANNDSATVDAGGIVGVDVLANDTDVDNTNAQLSVSSFTQPANGAVTKNADGTLDYTPNAGYNGTDSFTYKASDGTAESNEATVTITVNSPDAQCRTLASKTLGSSFNPDNYTFHGGTAADDTFTGTDGQSEVFCGFGGND